MEWIEEFHKALEQRKEPTLPGFTPPSAKEATNPFVPYTPPDWVKKVVDWHKANPYGPLPSLRVFGWAGYDH